MSVKVENKRYKLKKINCHDDGLSIRIRKYNNFSYYYYLEFGFPDYRWTLDGKVVNFVKFSPLAKAAIINKKNENCAFWYEQGRQIHRKEN